jgi:hypothetical protein
MFKVAEKGKRYLEAVDKYQARLPRVFGGQDIIARNVTENLYDRHIKSIFME